MIPRKKEDLSKLLLAPMPGLLVSILVKQNQNVDENQPLAIIEAMKMENIIRSEKKTKIKKLIVMRVIVLRLIKLFLSLNKYAVVAELVDAQR